MNPLPHIRLLTRKREPVAAFKFQKEQELWTL
jgi:hypothetical protein